MLEVSSQPSSGDSRAYRRPMLGLVVKQALRVADSSALSSTRFSRVIRPGVHHQGAHFHLRCFAEEARCAVQYLSMEKLTVSDMAAVDDAFAIVQYFACDGRGYAVTAAGVYINVLLINRTAH